MIVRYTNRVNLILFLLKINISYCKIAFQNSVEINRFRKHFISFTAEQVYKIANFNNNNTFLSYT